MTAPQDSGERAPTPRRWAYAWGCVAALLLWSLFELPSVLVQERVRLTAEVAAVLLAYGALARHPNARLRKLAARALTLPVIVLILYQIDQVAFAAFMGEEPLLYDQLFMVRHFLVLISDLWSGPSMRVIGALVAGVLLIAVLVWLVRFLARSAATVVRSLPRAAAGWLFGGVLAALVLGALPSEPPNVRWLSARLGRDVAESYAVYRSVQRAIADSAYRDYARLRLSRRPDVYLLLVESYGRLLWSRDGLRAGLHRRLRSVQDNLQRAGFSAVSAFSRAPVLGGRSWLCEASLLTGTLVRYEAVFRQMIASIDRVPNLIGFLHAQGYQSALLAPSDRVRPGVEAANYYGYHRIVDLDDLDYHGPAVGWGIVPDQYSLGVFRERVLPQIRSPRVIDAHLVSSHAPWLVLPWFVADYRALGLGKHDHLDPKGSSMLATRMKRYARDEGRYVSRKIPRDGLMRYARVIDYELQVIEDFVRQIPGDALVIVMGDHQPPLLAVESGEWDVPVHAFARDPKLLHELRAQGFAEGLLLPHDAKAALTHQGMFSLLVRTLLAGAGAGEQELPVFRREGATL